MNKTIIVIVALSVLLIECSTQVKTDGKKDACIAGDCMNGNGTMHYADGNTYKGEFKNGLKNGQGKSRLPNGSQYSGSWLNNAFNGQGTFSHSDGWKYIGQWKNGVRHGYGVFTSSDGGKYTGQWKDDQFDGQGTYIHPDGIKTIGQWKEGKPCGPCSITSEKNKFTGVCTGDGLSGQATIVDDDEEYVGQIVNFEYHGQGTLTQKLHDNPNITKKVSIGNFKEGLLDGTSTIIIYNQFGNIVGKYVGGIKNGKLFGKGSMYFYDRNGQIIKTQTGWWDGEFLGEQ